MKFDQKKYEAGEYAPDSLYKQLGELITIRDSYPPVSVSYHRVDYAICQVQEIIAQVEARVGELDESRRRPLSINGIWHRSLADVERESIQIEELTRLLSGDPARSAGEGEKHG